MRTVVAEVVRAERRLALADINRALDTIGRQAFVSRTRRPRRTFHARLDALCDRWVAGPEDSLAERWLMPATVVVEPIPVRYQDLIRMARGG